MNKLFMKQRLKFICCLIIIVSFSCHELFSVVPQKQNNISIIDLQKTQFNKTTTITLDNGWSFYWNKLILPGNFSESTPIALTSLESWTNINLSTTAQLPSFGYATYRLKIILPKKRPRVSLQIPKVYSASKLWINGNLISEIGKVGVSKETTQNREFSQIIPLNTNETVFEIVIQASNFYHNEGGFSKPLILATSKYLMNIQTKLIIADILLIGCIGFIGVICLLFFLFYWNKDSAVFYFSILCLSISYWTLSDKYAPLAISFMSLSWLFLMKIEYIAMFLSGASLNLFFNTIFSRFIPKLYVKLIVIIFSFLVILTTFLNELYLTKILVLFLSFMLLSYFFLTYLTLKTKLKERHDTILISSIMVLGSGIFCAHLFFFLNQDNIFLMYINFGYVVLFFLLSVLLMRRFSKSYRKKEEFNKLVIRQKEEIFVRSKELTSTNLALENNLNLLIAANEELDDFNHIVSHDLKSPLIAVHALTSFIQEDLKTTLKKETKQHLSLLQNVTSNMGALINGLLIYSKTGKNSKMKEFFFLNDLLATVIDLLDFKNESIINSPKENIEIYANRIE